LTAAAGGSGWSWLSGLADSALSAGGKLFGNTLSSDLMKLIGAGVSQYSAENATQEQRDWIDKQLSDKRRRQKPVATPGMFFTVNKGKNG
jgi:hypothetical protein